jgi:purine-binding chemotaxis protein CheW
MAREGIRVLLLDVVDRTFGVEVGQIETLRRKQTLFPARDGPPDLLGFLRLGGWAVPVLDLGVRLGLQSSAIKQMGLLVVAPIDPSYLAFRVDGLEGPVAVGWEGLSLLPELIRGLQSKPIVWGLAQHGDRLVPLLDLENTVSLEERTALREIAQVYEGG